MPFPNYQGNKRLWTREQVLKGLAAAAKEIKGPLPCHDREYAAIKKGHYDWPTTTRILEYFHSMARAWLAAGVNPKRVKCHNIPWLPEEDEYLLQHAGNITLKEIARYLHRTYQSVRARLGKTYRIQSRHNQGFMSAAELAREYKCPYHRIRDALRTQEIPGRYDHRRNRWEIDPGDVLSPSLQAILNKPKITYKESPTDVGDYYKRYGLKRVLKDGKIICTPVIKPLNDMAIIC